MVYNNEGVILLIKTHYNEVDLMYIAVMIKDNLTIQTTKLSVEYFDDVLAKLVFSLAVRAVNEKNVFLPLVDLLPLLADRDRLLRYANYNHPVKLIKDNGDAISAEDLIQEIDKYMSDKKAKNLEKVITERHTKSKLSVLNYTLGNDLQDSSKSTYELLRKYSCSLDALMAANVSTRQTLTSHDVIKAEKAFLDSDVTETFPKTGLIIDEVNEGLNAPSLTVTLGAAKSGKSTFLYNGAIASLKQGRSVLFATIEIPVNECFRKIMSIYSGIPYNDINKKKLSPEQEEEYLKAVEQFSKEYEDKLFIIDDSKGMSAKDISVYIQQLEKAGIKIDDVFVDYILIMKSNNPNLPKVEALSIIPQELRQLSQEHKVRVNSAQQLHTASIKKPIEELTYDDVYFCKTLAHECTYSIVITNERTSENKSVIKAMFLPSRQTWTQDIFTYPNFDQATLTLNEPEICKLNLPESSSSGGYYDDIIDWK